MMQASKARTRKPAGTGFERGNNFLTHHPARSVLAIRLAPSANFSNRRRTTDRLQRQHLARMPAKAVVGAGQNGVPVEGGKLPIVSHQRISLMRRLPTIKIKF